MRLAILMLALTVAGCGSKRDTWHDDELDDAKVQVRRFFDAIASGDCPTLTSLVPALKEPGSCAKLLHEWNEDLRVKLIELPDARRDGRDRHAIIVRATVTKHDEQNTMLVRVTHEQGAWQLVL